MRATSIPFLSRARKNRLRGLLLRGKQAFVRAFRSYDKPALVAALRRLGAGEGRALLVHSSFRAGNGFRGLPGDAIDAMQEAVGESGHLLMVSLPYRSSALAYFRVTDRFDARATPSAMGLLSELFRRRDGVLRSLHPMHPVLARGPKAAWIVGGHERCPYSCGPGSPFDKLLQLDGMVAFFDAPFAAFTFFHFLEHRVCARAGVSLYHETPFRVTVACPDGVERVVDCRVFSEEAMRRRRFPVLEEELRRRRLVRGLRIGNTRLEAVELREVVACVDAMADRGEFFYAREG
jgi:aminoglycoside 3-N-acetyltransferase